MKLIVGLGNPGLEYENTRHNVGFKTIDLIAKEFNISLNKNKFNGEYFQGNINDEKVILLKPLTYMNLSGECIIQFINYFKVNLDDILVIVDDMQIPLGNIRIRTKGSSGGQNGMKSIIEHLHSESFKRIRIGIGQNTMYDVKDYVLSKFRDDEIELINQAIRNAAQASISFINNRIDIVMNKYNKK
jgi:PTH1 family peptidyl-tRNA hydrolase